MKPGLENITTLLKTLGNPHEKLRIVHLAGTNGKGSTAAFLFSILNQSGLRAGLYTSPHLIDFRERITLTDRRITRQEVLTLISSIKDVCRKNGLNAVTFFEFVTAAAFLFFARQQADPVIIETGLGGRYDATNVVLPLISVITSIGMEHRKYLGNTLMEIAEQKAGIIKRGVPVVCGARQKKVVARIDTLASASKSPFYQLGRDFHVRKKAPSVFIYKGLKGKPVNLLSGLKGDHQFRNASLAAVSAEMLCAQGYAVTDQHIAEGIARAAWPGRLETVAAQPLIVADGAHNPDGWRALKKALAGYFSFDRLIYVIGLLQDKDLKPLSTVLLKDAYSAVFCRPDIDRAAGKPFIEKHIVFSAKKRIYWKDTAAEALKLALQTASPRDLVCVTGSLFIVGEIKQYLSGTADNKNMRVAL